jgi:pyruvate dehydrogenase E1 component alpha subunit
VRTDLLGSGAIDQAWLDGVAAESEALAERMRAGCVNLPEPRLEDCWRQVYANTPDLLEKQRTDHLAYEASFEVIR